MVGFFTSPRVAWGPGAVEQLSGLGARRALLVVDRAVAGGPGQHRVVEELAKTETVVQVVEAGPRPDHLGPVAELAKRMGDFAPDWLIAMGGGRALDGAKAARLLFERPDLTLAGPTPLIEVPDPPRCRLAALPTTSGSGAEASCSVDLWSDDGEPVELAHRSLAPEWALVDVALTGTLPADLGRDGGVQTLAQAAEAYVSAWSNPWSNALALAAVRTVVERLPHALKWSDDPEAKEELHYAATLAGLAASNAQRGVAHALARALVGPTGLPYGRLLGVLLPPVLEFDHPSARDPIETLGGAVRRADEATPIPLAARIRKLYEAVRAPSDLKAAGAATEKIAGAEKEIVARALRVPGVLANPRVPSATDLEAILGSVLGGTPLR